MTNIDITLTFDKLPTVTAQQKGMRLVNGKPRYYEKAKTKDARQIFTDKLRPFVPAEPIEGAVKLWVDWCFYAKSHKANTWRTTRPDTDNLQKLLKDVMTDCGFWHDDSQVCWDTSRKMWVSEGCESLKIKITEMESFINYD